MDTAEVKKKRVIRSAYEFRKKLFIPDYKISVSIEHKVKSKIGTIFVNEDILDLYFSENYKKRIQADNNGQQYMLFRFIYICCLNGHTDRDLEFEKKRQETLEKKLNHTFNKINTSKENFDVDYEVSRIQMFTSQFKDNKNKELEDEIKKLKLQLANLSAKNNEVNDKNKEYSHNKNIKYKKRSIVLLLIYIFYKKKINSTTVDLYFL